MSGRPPSARRGRAGRLSGARGPAPARDDPTARGWGEGLPIADEYRGSLAEAEADVAYRLVAPAVCGRDVLDLGAGAGHGAGILLEAGARSVVGVDHDGRAVEAARRLYGAHASFLQAEPPALPLAPGSFDVATCFAALEDSPDAEGVLVGLHRILTDHGLLAVSLPTASADAQSVPQRSAEAWGELLRESFRHVRLYRRRVCLAAAAAPAGQAAAVAIDSTSWLAGAESEERATLALASAAELPELPSVATLTGFRDLRAYRSTLAAWEERGRRAEADGSAKHWELVAAREAQRRLRKRVHELEHRPLRVLSRVIRGKPARIGLGPPIRASEREPDRWE